MKRNIFVRRALALFTVIILSFSFAMSTQSTIATILDDMPKDTKNIVIFSDGYDLTLKITADRIYQVIHAIYPDTKLLFIDSKQLLEYEIAQEYFINIYVLQGSLNGISIKDSIMSWDKFEKLLLTYDDGYHIVGFGNTKAISATFNHSDHVFVEGSDVIDAEFTFLYAIWKTADILNETMNIELKKIGHDLRMFVLQYYQDNAEDLYSRVIEPVDPLGERDHSEFLEKMNKMESYLELTGPRSDNDENQSISYDMVNPIMKLIPTPNKNAIDSNADSILYTDNGNNTYVPLMEVPKKSGLPGPLAAICDKFLKLLFDWLKEKTGATEFSVGLNLSIVQKIAEYVNDTVNTIKKWLNDNLFELIVGSAVGGAAITAITYGLIVSLGLEKDFWSMVESLAVKGVNALSDFINGQLKKLSNLLSFKGEYPIGLGDISAFSLKISLALVPEFRLLKEGFVSFINRSIFEGGFIEDPVSFFLEMLTPDFLTIMPVFKASLMVKSFGSDKSSFMKYLLESLGLELSFSGGGGFELALFKTTATFEDITYFEVLSWFFKFSIQITKSFTLLDFVTGGATSAGPIALIQKFLGLNKITIDIFFKLSLEIVKKAAKDGKPPLSTFTLDLTIGAALNIHIYIVDFYGAVEATLRFFQNITAGTPLEIFLILHLFIKVKINLLFFDIKARWDWYPLGTSGYRLTPAPKTPEFEANVQGLDSDMDGLSDDFENLRDDIDANKYDTDGDGLSDLEEISVTFTLPNVVDTDGDGLSDGEEYNIYHTNPKSVDTDRDLIHDGEEVNIYHTNPLMIDTDSDGLTDFYEINTSYPLENVTPSVKQVYIGGIAYNNHTDPLNPDTDNDGLLDGEEWTFGKKYGDPSLFNDTTAVGPLIIFGGGYTHPLDNDTDDDSYEQLANGTISPRHIYLFDMRDGAEIHGRWIVFINATTGDPEPRFIVTNPCIPDSDGDTAPGSLFLISDGYELSLTPPSDPNDADTDDDGLIDGLEGMNIEESNHTDYNNPDTDNDGLNDMLDTLLPTDPRDPDSDDDFILDGDEYVKYHTDPSKNDTDYDGLSDGDELFFFYTNPVEMDSDLDGLNDGEEVLIYDTDPLHPDTDRDGLSDFYEIFESNTNPHDPDTDDDGLLDGDELLVYNTDPLNWDTDGDSISQLNENGTITLNWGDAAEIAYGTDPTASDTDKDGLTDGQEIYLGMGSISFSPIPVDPLDNDTDNDGLLDGDELSLQNISIITYPYFALTIVFPFNTTPVNNDTDGDGLNDYEEISVYGTNPTTNDTDGDTLSDYDEVYIHGTDPANNDTDGDDLPDNEELTNATIYLLNELNGFHVAAINYSPKYNTLATDIDTDDDLLPDGEEIYRGTDPLNNDTDGDGILDGYEFDEDGDGLSDGEEFFIYKTQYLSGGGFNSSDSDGDGLSDGDEVNVYGTNCTSTDTDGDGFDDGLEVTWGTDPTSPTNATDISAKATMIEPYLAYALIGAAFIAGVIVMLVIQVILERRKKTPLQETKKTEAGQVEKKTEKTEETEKVTSKEKEGEE